MNGCGNAISRSKSRPLPSLSLPWFRPSRDEILSRLHRETTLEGRGKRKPALPSALAHNRSRITTRGRGGGGEKLSVHNSHAWRTLLVFVRFMLCHATRSSLSIDACVRGSAPTGGVGVGVRGRDPRGKQLSNISVGNNRSAVSCRARRYWMMGKRRKRWTKGDIL